MLSFRGLVRFLSRELSVCSGGFPSCNSLLFWETSHLLVPSSCLIVKGHGEEEYGSYCALGLGFFEPSTTPQLHVIRESSATGTPKNMVKIHGQNMSKRKNSVKKSVLLVISISFPMMVSWISP